MHIMSNLEYQKIISELSDMINGKYFGKIRKINEKIFRIKIGDIEILVEVGVRFHRTKYLENTQEKDGLCEKINKELDNKKVLGFEQINKDRILVLKFKDHELYFEMFGEGNIILVKDSKTVCAYRYEEWTDRKIRQGQDYRLPKSSIVEKIDYNDRYIVVSLMKLPLGKEYAKEILERLHIDEKKRGDELSEDERKLLETEIDKISKSTKSTAYLENGKIIDISLCELAKYRKLEKKEFGSFSEVCDEYYSKFEGENPELEKLKLRLEKQLERKQSLLEEEKQTKMKADWIYKNYETTQKIIEWGKLGKVEELVELFGKGKMKIEKKEKAVEIDLD